MDDADPLAGFRARFVGTGSPLVYLDGNSLGRPLTATAERLRRFVEEEWAVRLIRGWDERWFDLPLTLILTTTLAALSWHLVEKPALRLRAPLKRLEGLALLRLSARGRRASEAA